MASHPPFALHLHVLLDSYYRKRVSRGANNNATPARLHIILVATIMTGVAFTLR
jgi:hypothetical protein